VFFEWCVTEDAITSSPMANMRPPYVPEQPVPVLAENNLRRLLRTCDGKAFDDRRAQCLRGVHDGILWKSNDSRATMQVWGRASRSRSRHLQSASGRC
jgi:hypothetical protein